MDFKAVGKGFLIAIGGAGVTYLSEILTKIDFGNFTPIVVAVASTAINFLRKFITR